MRRNIPTMTRKVFLAIGLSLVAVTAFCQEMTNAEARAICDDFAQLESTARLESQEVELRRLVTVSPMPAEQTYIKEQLFDPDVRDSIRLDVVPGKSMLFVAADASGAHCKGSSIYPVPASLAPSASDGSDDELGRAAGFEDRLVQRHGRTFLIARETQSGLLFGLSWIKPTGAVRPMCKFEKEHTLRSVGLHSAPAALCQMVLEASSTIEWRWYDRFDTTDAAALRQLRDVANLTGFDETPELEIARVDIDNDGNPEDLARLHYSNSGGCGFEGSMLQVMDLARSRIATTSLNEQLQMASRGNEPISVRTVAGRQYIVTDSDQGGSVFAIVQGVATGQCSISNRYVLRVSQMFSVEPQKKP